MKKILSLCFIALPLNALAMGAEPWVYSASVHKLETNDNHHSAINWNLSASAARDYSQWQVSTEGHRSKNTETDKQEIEEANLRINYSHAISPYWDAQLGWQRDFQYSDKNDKTQSRDWLSIGFEGLIPWFIESEFSLLVNDRANTALHIELEKEWMLTQKWILQPELELRFYGNNDHHFHHSTGLAESEFSLRLKYRAGLKFYPYIGGLWQRHHSNTADLLRRDSESLGKNAFIVGFHYWY
ncbi:MAG: copper resistance protein B [Cellvibrionaceae bacterium]